MMNLYKYLGIILLTLSASYAQQSEINYSPSSEIFANPERGFYKYSSARSSNYQVINQNTLTNYRVNHNITLLFRYFYLNEFVNSPISNSYLDNMQTDFNRIRNAGMKVIVRFAYSDDSDAAVLDASKSRILSHIEQLTPILQNNADVIAVVQAGFIGAWGEWYYTDQAEFGGWGYNSTSLTSTNYAHRRDVLDALLQAVPTKRAVQIRYPRAKQQMYNTTTPLTSASAFNASALARIGHHNDCFLSSSNDVGTYSNMPEEVAYIEQETQFVPIGGETCSVFESRSNCTSAVEEMNRLHWSYLNLDYHPNVINGFRNDNCFQEIQNRLGYRFELIQAELPSTSQPGQNIQIRIQIRNTGFAAPYNKRQIYLILKNQTTYEEHKFLIDSDPRRWTNDATITLNQELSLPENIATGNYKMYLSLPDNDASISHRPEYAIRFANTNVWESSTGYNSLQHNLIISQSFGQLDADDIILEDDLKVFPVPTKDVLNIGFKNIDELTPSFFNSLGQKISLPYRKEFQKIVVDTQILSDGIYFVVLQHDNQSITKRFIVNR